MVLSLRPSPLGDDFVGVDRIGEPQPCYPIDCYLCRECGHLQLLDVPDPEELFRNYTYRTSVSLGLVEHFGSYAWHAVESLAIRKGSLVVEIGSNDGSLLKAFKTEGMEVLGIDPAREIAMQAISEGVPTIPEFFSHRLALDIVRDHGKASLICANNVFAHIDDMEDIATGIRSLLEPDGVFIFEVSYIVDMIDHMAFDTIYHEHISYHALTPLEKFLNQHDLTIFDAVRVQTKGGSVRVFAQPRVTGKRRRRNAVLDLLAEEDRRGICNPEIYQEWGEAIDGLKRDVMAYIDGAIAAGKTVAAYGASTTTTMLLYHFELENRIWFLVDDNPAKRDKFSPGAHIPVFDPTALVDMKPDVVVILAWLYADKIKRRNADYVAQGGTFFNPIKAA